jgi:AraC-type DNA-binding domain-containing proteins
MLQFDLSENLNTFYYATQLPIAVLKNGCPDQSLPEHIQTAAEVVTGKAALHVAYSPQEYNTVQYLSGEYEERFIVYVLNDTFIVAAGPFLTEPMHSGSIVNLIQNKKIPIKLKPKLESHYQNVKIISSQTYYYCGKLISLLFGSKNIEAPAEQRPLGHEVGFIQEYFQNTYKNREKMFTHPPYFLEKKLINQIKICDQDGALNTLREINLLNRAVLARDPLRSLRNSIICSCTFFTRAVIDAGVFPDIAFTYSDTFIQEIEKMNGLSEVRSYEQEIVRQFIQLVRESTSAKYSRPVFDAMQYINNSLTQKLNLADIARHAYVHPNYLSSLFKRETGSSITDFIARRRIEESTYFVAYTDYEIADIASFYHFCNQSYYCTLFKRYLAVSPNEYRSSATPSR